MKYIITIHVLSLLFGYYNGRHDVPAVNNFREYGSNDKDQTIFHSSNWKLKLIVCLAAFYPLSMTFSLQLIWMCGIGFLISGINIWMIFDPVLAKTRNGDLPWWYLSDGNKTDRFLIKIFGTNAGKWKLVICILLSTIATILYFVL